MKDDALMRSAAEHRQSEGSLPVVSVRLPFHCSVYAARPLICRLFGACAYQDKNGSAVFRRCKYKRRENHAEHIVLKAMCRSCRILYACGPWMIRKGRWFLPEKVASMLDQLQFLAGMLDLDDSNPDDTPNPLAS
jgi:hypothetical protein